MNQIPEPLSVRPAATVMMIRDTAEGLSVFLMRRHRDMEFAPGMMVFPGGGVDQRDYHNDVAGSGAWCGPDPAWWAQRFGVEVDMAEALVCAAVRETFEESGVLFASSRDDPQGAIADVSLLGNARKALADNAISLADFLRQERLVVRADLLRPWAHWVTPKAERSRRYDTYFFVAALPDGQCADGCNTESDQAGWATAQAAMDDFALGRSFLLPPTWTQLDSLIGVTVADVMALQRSIAVIEPHLVVHENNWEVEFFDSDRYNQVRKERALAGHQEPVLGIARRNRNGH